MELLMQLLNTLPPGTQVWATIFFLGFLFVITFSERLAKIKGPLGAAARWWDGRQVRSVRRARELDEETEALVDKRVKFAVEHITARLNDVEEQLERAENKLDETESELEKERRARRDERIEDRERYAERIARIEQKLYIYEEWATLVHEWEYAVRHWAISIGKYAELPSGFIGFIDFVRQRGDPQ